MRGTFVHLNRFYTLMMVIRGRFQGVRAISRLVSDCWLIERSCHGWSWSSEVAWV
jgi:hypothetical protein